MAGVAGNSTSPIVTATGIFLIKKAVYDTYDNDGWDPPQYGYEGDFPDEEAPYYPDSGWGNSVRTKLDSGNIKVE